MRSRTAVFLFCVAAQPLEALHLSVVTLAEIRFGIESLIVDAGRRAVLSTWRKPRVPPRVVHRVLPVSEMVMLTWRLLVEEGRKAGHTHSQPDPIIAATAAQCGLTVVSRDVLVFKRATVARVNPWNAASV